MSPRLHFVPRTALDRAKRAFTLIPLHRQAPGTSCHGRPDPTHDCPPKQLRKETEKKRYRKKRVVGISFPTSTPNMCVRMTRRVRVQRYKKMATHARTLHSQHPKFQRLAPKIIAPNFNTSLYVSKNSPRSKGKMLNEKAARFRVA